MEIPEDIVYLAYKAHALRNDTEHQEQVEKLCRYVGERVAAHVARTAAAPGLVLDEKPRDFYGAFKQSLRASAEQAVRDIQQAYVQEFEMRQRFQSQSNCMSRELCEAEAEIERLRGVIERTRESLASVAEMSALKKVGIVSRLSRALTPTTTAALLDDQGRVIGEVLDPPDGHTIRVAGAFTVDGTPVNVKEHKISREKENLKAAKHEDPVYRSGDVWSFVALSPQADDARVSSQEREEA